ncbi:MAG: hypothetical protein QNK37_10490 [Acidobacteriota bacterium]|nr:hypothetical protein [Acidobacteriota bacterium]
MHTTHPGRTFTQFMKIIIPIVTISSRSRIPITNTTPMKAMSNPIIAIIPIDAGPRVVVAVTASLSLFCRGAPHSSGVS